MDRKGFCVAEDEGEFWFFGGSTVNALRTFQACEGLPESGVVDEASWLALCGEDAEGGACDIGIGDGEAGPGTSWDDWLDDQSSDDDIGPVRT